MDTFRNNAITVIQTSYPNIAEAKNTALLAMKNNLASCVHIYPVGTSIYEWEGQIKQESEVVAHFKCILSKVDLCKNIILDKHPYDCPELIELSANVLHDPYFRWMKQGEFIE